jgi:hypothetical protein
MNKVPGYFTTVYQKQVAAFSPWRVGVMLLLQKVNIFMSSQDLTLPVGRL